MQYINDERYLPKAAPTEVKRVRCMQIIPLEIYEVGSQNGLFSVQFHYVLAIQAIPNIDVGWSEMAAMVLLYFS